MHDGVDRLLRNVRYLPEIKMNLISIGTLDVDEYSFNQKMDN